MDLVKKNSSRNKSLKSRSKIIYESIMAILALFSVIFIWNENSTIRTLDTIIWLIFVADVVYRLITAENKWNYLKKNPFDIIAIIPFDSIFRLARLARLIRLLRALTIMRHYLQPITAILKTNNLDKVLIFLIALIFVASIPIQLIEPTINSYADAIWWAIVTSTTVGYGDISPETGFGRLIAIVLMIFGIGLIGLVTSAIASYFSSTQQKDDPTIQYLKDQVSQIETLSDDEIDRIKTLLDSYKTKESSPR